MARMVIARILNPKGWRDHWEDRKEIAGNAIIIFQDIESFVSPPPHISDVTKLLSSSMVTHRGKRTTNDHGNWACDVRFS